MLQQIGKMESKTLICCLVVLIETMVRNFRVRLGDMTVYCRVRRGLAYAASFFRACFSKSVQNMWGR